MIDENLRAYSGLDFFDYIFDENGQYGDCCSWRGVDCTKGIVSTLVMTHGKRGCWSTDFDWLPQTLEYIHLHSVTILREWSTRSIPRKAKYFLLRDGYFAKQTPERALELRNLPQKLEELFIQSRDAFCGTVNINSLPESLKHCGINSPPITQVAIDNHGIPKNLERIDISATAVDVRVLGDEAPDQRIRTGPFEHAESTVYTRFHWLLCDNIREEMQRLPLRE